MVRCKTDFNLDDGVLLTDNSIIHSKIDDPDRIKACRQSNLDNCKMLSHRMKVLRLFETSKSFSIHFSNVL